MIPFRSKNKAQSSAAPGPSLGLRPPQPDPRPRPSSVAAPACYGNAETALTPHGHTEPLWVHLHYPGKAAPASACPDAHRPRSLPHQGQGTVSWLWAGVCQGQQGAGAAANTRPSPDPGGRNCPWGGSQNLCGAAQGRGLGCEPLFRVGLACYRQSKPPAPATPLHRPGHCVISAVQAGHLPASATARSPGALR